MGDNHLTYFKVENFKKFESLEVNDIGQFNLIVGDNNVGKTCLLEALLFDIRPKNTINWFHELLVKRRLIPSSFKKLNELNSTLNFESNTFSYYQRLNNNKIQFTINTDNFSIENIEEEINKSNNEEIACFTKKVDLFEYEGINKKSKNWIVFRVNNEIKFLLDLTSDYYEDFINKPNNSKIPNIPALMLNDEIENYLGVNYDKIFIKSDLGKKIAELIKIIFPSIEILEFQKENEISHVIDNYSLKIKTKERNQFHNIREYGEGFVRSLYMIIQLLSSKAKKIIIDEVDTGIHHTKLKTVWITIFKICKELDVQLFATTHSHECAKAYIEASKEIKTHLNEKKSFKLIELYNSEKEIKSFVTSGIENIEYVINNEPYRGENDYDV